MIHRQILVVRGKKRRKGGSGWKKTRWPFFCWSAGRIHLLLSLTLPPPTTLPCQTIKCNLYRIAPKVSFTRMLHSTYLSESLLKI
ncbi:hypothetical protein [Aneurinibacillus migulanus]|uniref:hypothetical protein n=1 Tax=Aneurinibacillus migulanus TaxID=47500 RepID=UPI001F2B520E|nr:hypothetical protein [Aneurinibacillus migulanus]